MLELLNQARLHQWTGIDGPSSIAIPSNADGQVPYDSYVVGLEFSSKEDAMKFIEEKETC